MSNVDDAALWAGIIALAFGRKEDVPEELLERFQKNVDKVMLAGSEYVRDSVKEEENDRN